MSSVMNKIKECFHKMKENKKIVSIILIVVLVLLLGLFLTLNGFIKNPFGNKGGNYSEDVKTDSALENSQTAAVKEALPSKVAVKIATLSSDDYDGAVVGEKAGCDIVRMVYRYIEPTPAILNATMKELFTYNQEFDYMPGNFVASQEKLKFEKAVLEEGTAKIYLIGEVEYAGACDNPRLESQIVATAKQFDTVYDVKIYLNGEEYEAPSSK